jgi:hypothetical protein
VSGKPVNANGFPRCEGFGDQEGRCVNAAVTPARIWCWPCEDKRRAHITEQMRGITQRSEEEAEARRAGASSPDEGSGGCL